MEFILKKVGLGSYIEAFENEKITPDVVCKMSLHDMHCVGLNDRSDIMKLRTACVSYRSMRPVTQISAF